MKNLLVLGSSNTDMVISMDEIPVPGQTVMGKSFDVFGGGKGANQAIAARRAGGMVRFLVSVGDDVDGRAALERYRHEGIDIGSAQVLADTASGVALIFVDANGENSIAVAPGANARLAPSYVEAHAACFASADLLLMQLEVPIESVKHAAALAHRSRIPVILNPAPAAELPDSLLDGIYCLTPNETEAEQLSGQRVTDLTSAERAADALLARGVRNVIITLGRLGALLKGETGLHHEPAPAVDVVDTTAAGDTFNGILAALLAEGNALPRAMKFAVRGAALSVGRRGAAESIPYRAEYDPG